MPGNDIVALILRDYFLSCLSYHIYRISGNKALVLSSLFFQLSILTFHVHFHFKNEHNRSVFLQLYFILFYAYLPIHFMLVQSLQGRHRSKSLPFLIWTNLCSRVSLVWNQLFFCYIQKLIPDVSITLQIDIRRSEDVHSVLSTFSVRSNYVLCLLGFLSKQTFWYK